MKSFEDRQRVQTTKLALKSNIFKRPQTGIVIGKVNVSGGQKFVKVLRDGKETIVVYCVDFWEPLKDLEEK